MFACGSANRLIDADLLKHNIYMNLRVELFKSIFPLALAAIIRLVTMHYGIVSSMANIRQCCLKYDQDAYFISF